MRPSVIVIFAALAAAGCAGADLSPPEPRDGPAPAAELRGRALLEARCGGCHALGRVDASPLRAAPPFREVVRRYPVAHLEEALAEGVVTAHPAMPTFAFEADEVTDVLAYLSSLE